MTSLLAIVLVGKTTGRGSTIIYSYPPNPKSVPRTSKPIYPTRRSTISSGYISESSSTEDESSEDNDSDDDSDLDLNLDGEKQGNGLSSEGGEISLDNYLGFSNTTLASLLSPNRELCDQPFELVVNHLAFIGHPVYLGDELSTAVSGSGSYDYTAADEDEERGRSRRRQLEKEALLEEQQHEEEERMDRDVTLSPNGRHSTGLPIQSNKSTTTTTSSTLLPNPQQQQQESFASSQHSHISLHGSGKLVSFNFVAIIDTPADSHLSSHLEGYYKDLVIPLTANIKALERKELWLGKETAKLRRILESDMEKGLTPLEHLASLPSLSPLAAAISQLYTSLKLSQLATISLGTLPVQVLLRGEVPMEEQEEELNEFSPERERNRNRYQDKSDSEGEGEEDRARSVSPSPAEGFQSQRPPPLFSRLRRRPPVKFQPWETFLPLENIEESKREVEEGTLLWRFLDICSPTLSFGEYETLLDVETEGFPLKEIIEHLVHWKKGRIIDVVSLKGFYAINPSFELNRLPSLAQKFRLIFPSIPSLLVILSQLPPCDSFSTIVPTPSLRSIYLSALIWLLTNEIVVKQRVFIRLTISSQIKSDSSLNWSSSLNRRRQTGIGSISTGGSSLADSTLTDDGNDDEVGSFGTASSGGGIFNENGSNSSVRSVRSNDGLRRKGSRPDFEDSKGMAIIGGSNSGISPTLTDSLLAANTTTSRSFSRSFQAASNMKLGSNISGGSRIDLMKGNSSASGRDSKRTMSTGTYSSANSVDGGDEEFKSRPSIILEPGRPSALESRWLVEICRGKDKNVVEKFDRVVRMLNGSYHLDEIRHRASCSRKDIRLLLAAFESHFILFTHQ